jgi:phosphoribosyl-ATP pyrophosphohydrolase/phosphoribosyl-AMP cyclohydrolase
MKREDGPARLTFDDKGLIPAVVQHVSTGRVLMVAFMSRESLDKTIETGEAHFWSRRRNELWRKGATSGNVMKVVEILADCDADCLLLRVAPAGPACHTGEPSCFFTTLATAEEHAAETSLSEVLDELSRLIRDRKEKRPEGSYTAKLFAGGVDRIAKKVGEESAEVIIASKNRDPEELCRESADLLYHLLVLWEQVGISPSRVGEELKRRRR